MDEKFIELESGINPINIFIDVNISECFGCSRNTNDIQISNIYNTEAINTNNTDVTTILYNLWLQQGFSGTELEFLKWIRNKSAYQSYLDTTSDNPVLTEQQWSNQLAGVLTILNSI